MMSGIKSMLNIKQILFTLFCIGLAYVNLTYLHTDNFFERLIIRIPQALILLWIYKKFINQGEIRNTLKKFRFNGKLHYVVMIIGILFYLGLAVFNYYTPNQTREPTEQISGIINMFKGYGLVFAIIYILSFSLMLPIIYAVVQIIFYSGIFIDWVYTKHKKYIVAALVIDDIALLAFFSLLI